MQQEAFPNKHKRNKNKETGGPLFQKVSSFSASSTKKNPKRNVVSFHNKEGREEEGHTALGLSDRVFKRLQEGSEKLHMLLHGGFLVVRERLQIFTRIVEIKLVNLPDELRDCGNGEGIKHLDLVRVKGHANTACFGVHAERALEQVVQLLADVHIKSGVSILKKNFAGR